MAKLVSELITSVKKNLGNISIGTVGGVAIDTVVLEALNEGISIISTEYGVFTNETIAEVDIVDTTNIYSLPSSDEDSVTITINNIISARILKDGETHSTSMRQVTTKRWMDDIEAFANSNHTGTPRYYVRFKNKLRLYPYPDDDYTLYLYVRIWPTTLTTSDLGNATGLGGEWDTVLEAYATYIIFQSLEQMKASTIWYANYKEKLGIVLGNNRDNTDLDRTDDFTVTDPQNDPFVKKWNPYGWI